MQDAEIVRKVVTRNAEIQECRRQVQYWTDRLNKLEAERRKETLLTRFEVDPNGAWSSLTHEERQGKIYIIAALQNNAYIASEFPFSALWGSDDYVIPEHLSTDRDVVLAYVAAKGFQNCFFNSMFEVPVNLRDDKEVMLAVCSKNSKALELASSRLQDDRDVVRAALIEGSYYSASMIKFSSDRLRKDKELVLTAVGSQVMCCDSFYWFEYVLLRQMTANDEKEVALAVLKRISEDSDNSWSCGDDEFKYFSESVRGDKELALMFIQRDGGLLQWCSDRLKQDREVVKAAVAQSFGAVEYCQGKIREELTSDSSFMLTAIKRGFGGLLPLAPSTIRNDASIVLDALAKGLSFSNVPAHMRADPKILLTALQHRAIGIAELPQELRTKKSFILEAVKVNSDIYRDLPEFLQTDDDIALAAVKAEGQMDDSHYCTATSVFRKVPSLLNSREALMAATKVEFSSVDDFLELLAQCPFLDDRGFMLAACTNMAVFAAELASARLREDRNFILAAMLKDAGLAIYYTSHEFQSNNIDVVLKAIEMIDSDIDSSELCRYLAPDVWNHRQVVLAWLKRGWPLLDHLSSESDFLSDAELVCLAVKADYSEFECASPTLRVNRDFVLSLVEIDGRTLAYAVETVKYDFDVLVAAIANDARTISKCFADSTDFDFLVSFASKVRSKLELHDVFVKEILRGIAIATPHVAPANRCQLPLLDRGSETSVGFKKLIAEYLGAPLGKELQMLRKVSSSLFKFGY